MSVRLSDKGIVRAQRARKEKDMTYIKLAERAYLAEPTIKRFISGKGVSKSSFQQICNVLGLDDWENLIAETPDSIQQPYKPKTEETGSTESIKGSIAISGVFTENKQRQIRSTLEMLKKLLLDGDFIITMDEDESGIV